MKTSPDSSLVINLLGRFLLMVPRIYMVWFVSLAIVSCSEQLSERQKSIDEADKIVMPVPITGSYLADYKNARIRCSHNNSQDLKFEVTCNVAIQINGAEILANKLDANTQIVWKQPLLKQGMAKNLECQIDSSQLSQKCDLEVSSSSVNLGFAFQLQFNKESRTEEANVLLPYSVEVAAGYVPNLGIYLTEKKPNEAANLTNDHALQHYGFQVPQIHQDNLQILATKSRTCWAPHGLYYADSASGSVFRFSEGQVRHFAGSAYDLGKDSNPHALRLKMTDIFYIACSDDGIYVRDRKNIYFIHKDGPAKYIQQNIAMSYSAGNASNFYATPKGELYFQNDVDLLKFDPENSSIATVIKDFNNNGLNVSSDLKRLGNNFSVANDGSYLYRDLVAMIYSKAKTVLLTRQYNDSRKVVYAYNQLGTTPNYYEFPLENTEFFYSLNADYVSNRMGDIYFSYSINEEFELRKLNRKGEVSTIANIPDFFDYKEGETGVRVIAVDDSENVYLYDVAKKRIVMVTKHGELKLFHAESLETSALKTAIDPDVVQFLGEKSAAFFNAKTNTLTRLENDSLSKLEKISNCRYLMGLIKTAKGYVYTCARTIQEIDTHDGVTSVLAGKVSPYGVNMTTVEGPASDVYIDRPLGLTAGQDGALYFGDMNRVRKLHGGMVSTIAGNPDFDDRYGWVGGKFESNDPLKVKFDGIAGLALGKKGEIYVADGGNHVVRKIAKDADDGKLKTSIEAGGGYITEIPEGSSVAANDFRLKCPSQVEVTGDGVMYIIDDDPNCMAFEYQYGYVPEVRGIKGKAIRKIEVVERNGVPIREISTFFGNEKNKECGSGKAQGRSRAEHLDSILQNSLSVICQGGITSIDVRDTCDKENGSVEILIGQKLGGDYGNIIHIRRPCRKNFLPL